MNPFQETTCTCPGFVLNSTVPGQSITALREACDGERVGDVVPDHLSPDGGQRGQVLVAHTLLNIKQKEQVRFSEMKVI